VVTATVALVSRRSWLRETGLRDAVQLIKEVVKHEGISEMENIERSIDVARKAADNIRQRMET
jgi:hypothetical protein